MRKVLRGYAKAKDAISSLSARCLSLIARINRPQENVKTKDIWSGKAQRSLRKSLLANRHLNASLPFSPQSRALGRLTLLPSGSQ